MSVNYYETSGNHPWPEAISDGLTLPCEVCGLAVAFDYRVRDDVWERVVTAVWQRGVLCLPCLDRHAHARGIDIAEGLENIQFTGVGKTIVLVPRRVHRYQSKGAQPPQEER